MKRPYEKGKIIFHVLVIFVVIAGSNSCKKAPVALQVITEDDIREMIYDVEAANRNRDIEGIMRYLSPDVEITITLDTLFGPQKMQWTRTKYKIETKNAWANASSYTYKRQNDHIAVSDDGQSAHVETDIFEVITIQGKTIKQKTRENIDIEIIGGRLLVTKLEAIIKT